MPVGIPSVKPVIENITPTSPVAMAQIEPNTQILAIDGKNTPDWETINLLLTDKLGSDSVELTLTPLVKTNLINEPLICKIGHLNQIRNII